MVEGSLHKNSHKNKKKCHQNNDEKEDSPVGEIPEGFFGKRACSLVSNFSENPLLVGQ